MAFSHMHPAHVIRDPFPLDWRPGNLSYPLRSIHAPHSPGNYGFLCGVYFSISFYLIHHDLSDQAFLFLIYNFPRPFQNINHPSESSSEATYALSKKVRWIMHLQLRHSVLTPLRIESNVNPENREEICSGPLDNEMEQGAGVIEPLAEGEWQSGEDTATSDYDPSIAESRYGSLTSSVNDHVWEYGRRYHTFREGRYPIPNDDLEYNREYMRHAMLKEILEGKLFIAPIGTRPQKIADLGTGFGDWAIEMGETYPSAKVVGVDLSPIQPVWIPPNVEFVVDDIEDEWVQDSDFDFIHLRWVSITLKDNETLFRRIFENLKPGGWVESVEVKPRVFSDDDTVKPDHALLRFYDLTREVLSTRYGFQVEIAHRISELMQRIGFINVREIVMKVPVGEWPRDQHQRIIGRLMKEVSMDLCVAMSARPFIENGMEEKEREELQSSVKAVLNDRRVHAQLPVYFIVGQKPPLSAHPSTTSFGSSQQT
nr:conserved hypothetical protein [Neurospora crassa]